MISILKLVALLVAAQFMVVTAFMSPNGSVKRSGQVQREGVSAFPSSPSAIRLEMAVASPTPVKKKEKKVVNESDSDSEKEKERGWLVRLYNDPMNKREFVAMCLNDVCGLDDGASFTIMMKAHQTGIAVIGNYHRELAEMYKMRLSEEGLTIDMVPADDE